MTGVRIALNPRFVAVRVMDAILSQGQQLTNI